MAKQDGAKLKEARAAAGLSQKALAEKAGCVTATDISKAERDLQELTPEQLAAVALALGVALEELTDAPPVLTDAEKELLKLYKSADPETKNAAAAVLKGEQPQAADPMAAMMGMFGGMMGGGNAAGGENAGGDNPMAGMMNMFSGMMGGGNAGDGEKEEAPEEDQKE